MTTEAQIILLLRARKTGNWEDLSMWLSIPPKIIKPIIGGLLRSKRLIKTGKKTTLYSGGKHDTYVVNEGGGYPRK